VLRVSNCWLLGPRGHRSAPARSWHLRSLIRWKIVDLRITRFDFESRLVEWSPLALRVARSRFWMPHLKALVCVSCDKEKQ
jgi:hypothetical protein